MSTSIITTKGQVTIPKKIRDRLGLKTGDTLYFEVDAENRIVVTPSRKSAEETFGILFRKDRESLSVEEMDRGVAEYFRNKYKVP